MNVNAIKNITIIGAGMMGHGIALIFAERGYNTCLYDIQEEYLNKAIVNIESDLKAMAKKGIISNERIASITGKIRITIDIKEACADSHFVVEAAPENLELKQDIFHELDMLCASDAILATNTSVISVSEIAAKATGKERITGTHFWNPPYLVPLVEVVKGNQTSEDVQDTTYQLLKKVGKHPVKVMKDVPGFIGNRLQHALWREAISIVEKGIADAAGVDDVIKKGFGLRLPVLGPLENADMVGLDLVLSIHDYILKYIEASPEPSPVLKNKALDGQLGFKSGQGFYSWTPETIEASRRKLQDYLLEWSIKHNQ